MKYSTIVVAAGSGSRTGLGYNKMFYRLPSGRCIIEESVRLFLRDDDCREVIIVCRKEEQADFQKLFAAKKIRYVSGGATRGESVYHGLCTVTQDHVLVHDGARPYLDEESLKRLLKKTAETGVCLLAVPVKDTIKVVENGLVSATPKRELLWCAQTPQAFSSALLKQCYEKTMKEQAVLSDDAAVVEYCGHAVHVVMGNYENSKVTTADDLH